MRMIQIEEVLQEMWTVEKRQRISAEPQMTNNIIKARKEGKILLKDERIERVKKK